MIHEVMVLDHSGPDFAMILYSSAIKLWIFCALLAGLLVPVRTGNFPADATATLLGMFMLAVGIGIVVSSIARLRLMRIPQLLSGAGVLAVLAIVLVL
jgi:formate hydrogenlyase subunit 4